MLDARNLGWDVNPITRNQVWSLLCHNSHGSAILGKVHVSTRQDTGAGVGYVLDICQTDTFEHAPICLGFFCS